MTALIGGPGSSHLRTGRPYRRRLAELDRELAAALTAADAKRARRLERERGALGAELERASGLGHRSRPLGASTVERAGEGGHRTDPGRHPADRGRHPELGASLNRSLITGISCRYDPVEPLV